MDTATVSDEEFAILELLSGNEDLVASHPWGWEGSRWKELAFALLVQVARFHEINLYEQAIREVVERLDDYNLLNVDLLAHVRSHRDDPDEVSEKSASRFLKTLREIGFSKDAAETGLATVGEAALGLKELYDGKIQRYLRHYGELMLKEFKKTFEIASIPEAQVADAVTYWLQNAVSLPVSLIDSNVQRFCKERHFGIRDLLTAADHIGLSFSLLDDLVQRDAVRSAHQKEGGKHAVVGA